MASRHNKRAKHQHTAISPDTIINQTGKSANHANSKINILLKILSLLLLCEVIYRAYIFYHLGYSGYINTVLIYIFLFITALAFIPGSKKTLRINILALLFIMFAGETYLRQSGNGYLNYTERNSKSIFSPYITAANDYSNTSHTPQLWIEKPEHEYYLSVKEYSYLHQINEIGLRERNLKSFKGHRTILVLGDSFTHGVGAPADSTGVASLEKNLSGKGKNILCYNGGTSGSDICFTYKLYEKVLKDLHPEVVILNLNQSDISDIINRGGDERFTENGVKFKETQWYQFPYSWSYIFRVLIRGVFKVKDSPSEKDQKTYQALQVIKNKIADFRLLAQRDSFHLVVAFTPLEFELMSGRSQLGLVKAEIQSVFPDIFVMDYMDYFFQNNIIAPETPDSYYYQTDLHFKPKGYWLWGQVLADTLISKKLVE